MKCPLNTGAWADEDGWFVYTSELTSERIVSIFRAFLESEEMYPQCFTIVDRAPIVYKSFDEWFSTDANA